MVDYVGCLFFNIDYHALSFFNGIQPARYACKLCKAALPGPGANAATVQRKKRKVYALWVVD